VVTGSTKGLGKGIATGFAEAGANVVVNSRTPGDVERVAAALDDEGAGETLGIAADVADPGDVERLIDGAIDAFGGVDHLVNNAAVWPDADPLDGDLEDFDLGMAVNARAPYYAAVLAARDMRARDVDGSVVNVTSIKGHREAGSGSLYGMSKAAQNGVTWRLATALAPDVRVNGLSTGIAEGVPSRNAAESLDAEDPSREEVLAELDRWADDVPMQRAGRREDLADGALFLASDRASYVTGHVLRVGGGVQLG
jgi:NAD(P)-dependent dehydrogenase (short-subunit alcohol dehydrogenase family)